MGDLPLPPFIVVHYIIVLSDLLTIHQFYTSAMYNKYLHLLSKNTLKKTRHSRVWPTPKWSSPLVTDPPCVNLSTTPLPTPTFRAPQLLSPSGYYKTCRILHVPFHFKACHFFLTTGGERKGIF